MKQSVCALGNVVRATRKSKKIFQETLAKKNVKLCRKIKQSKIKQNLK